MLSEISRTEKDKLRYASLVRGTLKTKQVNKHNTTESERCTGRGKGGGGREKRERELERSSFITKRLGVKHTVRGIPSIRTSEFLNTNTIKGPELFDFYEEC